MKSKVVLVLWYINLRLKLAASIPFYEDSAQNFRAHQASGLPSNVLENKNAHSQLENLVALSHSFNPDNNYPREVRTIEQERAVKLEQRGDTRWHALSRANSFPATPQDVKAPVRYQDPPIPYRSGNLRPEVPNIPQILHNQQNLKQVAEAPFIRQPVNIQLNQRPIATQPVVSQAIETQSSQLPFIRQPEKVQMPFIRQPMEVQSVQSHLNQRYEGPLNVELSRQPVGPLHQQQFREQIPPNSFISSNRPEQTFEKQLFRPVETLINRQLFTQNIHNQQMRPQENTTPSPGVNLQQIVTNNELKKAAAAKTKSRYTVVYPNGSVEYVNQLEPIAKKYPNYVMMNGNKAFAPINAPLGHLSPQMQNVNQPSNPAQYVINADTQVPVNTNVQHYNEAPIQTQNVVHQMPTQNHVQQLQTQNNVQHRPNQNNIEQLQIQTHSVSQSQSKQQENDVVQTQTPYTPITPIDQASTPVVTPAIEIVSLPPEFDVEEIPFDAVETELEVPNNFVTDRDDKKETQIVNTSYATANSRSERTSETEKSDNVLNNENDFQTIQSSTQGPAQSNNMSNENQKQTHNTTQSQSSYNSEEEDQTIARTETICTLPENQSQEQSESNFVGDDHSDNEQQQTQVGQEQTQTSTESLSSAQFAPSLQQTQNESTTNSQRSDIEDNRADTQITGEGQDEETSSNADSTASLQSQSESQSRSNTQLNNASSADVDKGRPYAWFSTQDPDFLEKLLGKNKVLDVIYFFMVPSDAPYYPD